MPQIDLAGVGQRLEALRQSIGLNSREFAASFDLDPSSYSKTAQGEKILRSQHAFIISERWNVSMDYIYRGRLHDLPTELRDKILKHLNSDDE